MDHHDRLVDRFETHRSHLTAVAYRILGSAKEAEDAVQEAWIQLSRSDSGNIENLGGWLTTVTARISLDVLRARASKREDPCGMRLPDHDTDTHTDDRGHPEAEAILAEAVGSAMLVVLDALGPAERVAFVLHDMFAVSFDDIGSILGRSSVAAKQLASRARHKVQGPLPDPDRVRQREVVGAFLAASRNGDFDALMALLHPDITLRADPAAVRMGSPEAVLGAAAVASTFSGRAQGAQPALIDGTVGMAWAPGGQLRVAWAFTISEGRVVSIDMIASPEDLEHSEFEFLDE